MKLNHVLRIQDDDAVETLRRFLSAWWMHVELDAMLAPVELPDHGGVAPEVIEHPDELRRVNPFLPMMPANTVPLVDGFIKEHRGGHLAVILRPCELRALIELQKRNRVQVPQAGRNGHRNLTIIGVDCPGTFSVPEYAHHMEQHFDDAEMMRMTLAYGSQESYLPYPFRAACQMCDSPAPFGADVTIGSIGVAPQGYLLAIAADEQMDASLRLSDVTDGAASDGEVFQREVTLGKLAEKRSRQKIEMLNKQDQHTDDMKNLLAVFARCTLCADCLDACPLYDGELAGMLGVKDTPQQRTRPLLTELVSVSRWLASCSGCGMCQEVCEHGVSLMPIITTMSHRIQRELHYRPGDPNQRLPWNS